MVLSILRVIYIFCKSYVTIFDYILISKNDLIPKYKNMAKEQASNDIRNEKQKALELTLGKIEKDFGKGTIMKMGDNAIVDVESIPSGSIALDVALGIGGYPRGRVVLLALATGLVEPIGGLLGVSIVSIAAFLLPYGLAFAAGAMIFVVGDEMIPESHSSGNARLATWGIMIGFVIMMTLDNIFHFLFGG